MEDYVKNQRFTKVDRCRSGISSHKVLAKSDNSVTVGASRVISSEEKVNLNMTDTSNIEVGDYLDFQFSYTVSGGRANGYSCRYLGKTPDQFVPADGAPYAQ